MQWLELTKAPAKETQKKTRQRTREKNDREINERLRLEGKAYKTLKGKDVPAVPPMKFVTCKCESRRTNSLPMEIRKVMYEQFWGISIIDQRK